MIYHTVYKHTPFKTMQHLHLLAAFFFLQKGSVKNY